MESNKYTTTNTPSITTTTTTPSKSTISRPILLLLRVLTFVFLLISFILIVLTKQTSHTIFQETSVKFTDVYAFRYMISTIVIGFAYNVLQMALSLFNVVLSRDMGYMFDYFGDKIISYFLLSGSAAGFGASQELHRLFPLNSSFFTKANASATFLLFGFLSTAIASIFTSFALRNKA